MTRFMKPVVSLVFAFSAGMKVLDFENTARYFQELTGHSFETVGNILGVVILVEFTLAWGLLLNRKDERLILKFALAITSAFLLFSGSLAVAGATNCACFGTYIAFNPWLSFGKCLLLTIFLSRIYYESKNPKIV